MEEEQEQVVLFVLVQEEEGLCLETLLLVVGNLNVSLQDIILAQNSFDAACQKTTLCQMEKSTGVDSCPKDFLALLGFRLLR